MAYVDSSLLGGGANVYAGPVAATGGANVGLGNVAGGSGSNLPGNGMAVSTWVLIFLIVDFLVLFSLKIIFRG